jgi:hypothetical protein
VGLTVDLQSKHRIAPTCDRRVARRWPLVYARQETGSKALARTCARAQSLGSGPPALAAESAEAISVTTVR